MRGTEALCWGDSYSKVTRCARRSPRPTFGVTAAGAELMLSPRESKGAWEEQALGEGMGVGAWSPPGRLVPVRTSWIRRCR